MPDSTSEINVIENVLYALQDVLDTSAKEAAAAAEFKGYSWDYYGRHLIEAKKTAQKQFSEEFEKYVDERIEAALKRRTG